MKDKIKIKKYINILTLILFVILSSIDKKYEDKSIKNIIYSFSSINKLLNYEDKIFLNQDYNDFISYYRKLTSSDKCITLFTHEVALTYFIKKPTCSKFYLMYTASPEIIQKQLIKDIASKNPLLLFIIQI